MTFPSSGGRGRRLPASGSFDILWFLQRSVALLPHAIFRPLPGGSPMGAARSMLHASPPGGSLPIRECTHCPFILPASRLVLAARSVSPAAVELRPALPAAARTGHTVTPTSPMSVPQARAAAPGPPGSHLVVHHFPLTIVLDGAPVFPFVKCPSTSPLPFHCTSPFDPSSL
jgi:hypothetical protein